MADDPLEAFDEELARDHLYGQWTSEERLRGATDGPAPAGVPHVWRWAMMKAHLDRAAELMPESFTARRSLMFTNPGLPRGTTHTLAMGVQRIEPGEIAWAHRHSIAALRFVIAGNDGLYTVVDGEPCPMADNDLVLTPGWAWHDHHNEGSAPAYWVDVLDVPLIGALNQAFYQPLGENRQAVADRPTAVGGMRYPWREMEAALMAVPDAEASPFDGVVVAYAGRATGGPVLPTIACWAHRLPPGAETQPHRRTSSAAYFVIAGRGRTRVGDVELEWGPRDGFCVPNWATHHHVNASAEEDAILVSVHDIPAISALGLYREDPGGALAAVRPAPVPERI